MCRPFWKNYTCTMSNNYFDKDIHVMWIINYVRGRLKWSEIRKKTLRELSHVFCVRPTLQKASLVCLCLHLQSTCILFLVKFLTPPKCILCFDYWLCSIIFGLASLIPNVSWLPFKLRDEIS